MAIIDTHENDDDENEHKNNSTSSNENDDNDNNNNSKMKNANRSTTSSVGCGGEKEKINKYFYYINLLKYNLISKNDAIQRAVNEYFKSGLSVFFIYLRRK